MYFEGVFFASGNLFDIIEVLIRLLMKLFFSVFFDSKDCAGECQATINWWGAIGFAGLIIITITLLLQRAKR